jgi:hypothetical protein
VATWAWQVRTCCRSVDFLGLSAFATGGLGWGGGHDVRWGSGVVGAFSVGGDAGWGSGVGMGVSLVVLIVWDPFLYVYLFMFILFYFCLFLSLLIDFLN